MTLNGWIQIAIYCAVVLALVKPLGWYMTAIFNGERSFLSPVLRPVEQLVYRVARIDERSEVDWKRYSLGMLLFNLVSVLFVYLLQRLQGMLPLNPADMSAVSPNSSFNTAVSFATNTNWQGYGGEATMS